MKNKKGYTELTIGQIKDGWYKQNCPSAINIETEYSRKMPNNRSDCTGDCDECWNSNVAENKEMTIVKQELLDFIENMIVEVKSDEALCYLRALTCQIDNVGEFELPKERR